MQVRKTPDASEFREQLIGFNEKVRRLEHTRFFQSPAVAFSLNRVRAKILSVNQVIDEDGDAATEIEMQTEVSDFDLRHLDRDNIDAFTLTYRMLTQNNDRFSIGRLAENYEFAHPLFHNAFTQLREQNTLFLSTSSPLQPGGHAVTYREILDTVIYGELAHSNKKKAAMFQHWTRWPAHEKSLWLVFDHALRCSMEVLRHFRDLNAATLMVHFAVPVREESVFQRLQEKGIIRKDLTFSATRGND